jgi:hypothetical protein
MMVVRKNARLYKNTVPKGTDRMTMAYRTNQAKGLTRANMTMAYFPTLKGAALSCHFG